MPRDLPSIRIFPMSDKIPGFHNRSIEDVQKKCFLRDLPQNAGRFRYSRTGLNAPAGTLVLFQFKSRIVASAIFLRDEKFPRARRGSTGEMHFDPKSFQTFTPLDTPTLKKIWPAFRALGHVKHRLNPTAYPLLKKRLKQITKPSRP